MNEAAEKQRRNSENLTSWKWKPGVSGNPAGRPPKDQCCRAILADICAQTPYSATATAKEKRDRRSNLEILLFKLVSMAIHGNLKAAEIVLDRLYGKPTQPIDQHTTNEDKKLDITVTVIDEVKPENHADVAHYARVEAAAG